MSEFIAAIFLSICISSIPVSAQAIPQSRHIAFEMASLTEVIRPMRHPLGSRMPLLMWEAPIPRGDALIWAARSGSLRKAIDQLSARGIVPTVIPPGQGAVALARALQEAGQPVYVLIARADLIEATAYQNCPVWAQIPDESRGGRVRKWPCLPLADGAPGARWVTQTLQSLHDAGIKVAGVFFDDEGLPAAWENVRLAQAKSSGCRDHYPAGVLDDPKAMQQYIYELRSGLIDQIMVQPVHTMFPGAVVGNFGELPLIDAKDQHTFHPDVVMQAVYAFDKFLPATYGAERAVTQQQADEAFFEAMMGQYVIAMKGAQLFHKAAVPYMGQALLESENPGFRFALSRSLWRELQYHVWLRGAHGMYLFNPSSSKTGLTPGISFQSVEDARAAYDDLLEHKEFLDSGEVMNLSTYARGSHDPVWSGLRLQDRCLIRAFTPFTDGRSIEIEPFPGVKVKLDAPLMGRSYIVDRNGTIKTL